MLSILLLIYWVFVVIAVQVFGFKIFRENISQTFAMSILGIFALMVGSLIINVMFNLTRIAERHNIGISPTGESIMIATKTDEYANVKIADVAALDVKKVKGRK